MGFDQRSFGTSSLAGCVSDTVGGAEVLAIGYLLVRDPLPWRW